MHTLHQNIFAFVKRQRGHCSVDSLAQHLDLQPDQVRAIIVSIQKQNKKEPKVLLSEDRNFIQMDTGFYAKFKI